MFFRPQSSTFAPVNQETRRHIASWLLLAVIVPMLLLSSVHIHENHVSEQATCVECVAHHCHGHITPAEVSFDTCVVCQFLTLSFVAAALSVVALVFNVLRIHPALKSSQVCSARWGKIVTRGPPTV